MINESLAVREPASPAQTRIIVRIPENEPSLIETVASAAHLSPGETGAIR